VRRDRKEAEDVRRVLDWIVALVVLLLGRRKPKPREVEERIVPPAPPDRRAETVLILLFGASALCAGGFIAVVALDRIDNQTPYLGLSLGLSLAFFSAALVLLAKRLVVTEELDEPYTPVEHPVEQAELVELVAESGDRFTRKRLVTMAGAGAVGTLGLALVAPVVSLGPVFDLESFATTPWRRGRLLVGEDGRPLRADEIEEGTFYTAYAAHADREQLGSPLVLVRLPPSELHLPSGRGGWAPEGILAYSKICTHAGCAIGLYRYPLYPPAEPRPALVCPCHYSTFDPATGGTVIFGPAGRPLPQLPLAVGSGGLLRAAGNFSGPVGPSWSGVRDHEPRNPA
jgi:ubiquinol-cytochrome c reductase iron-sulfur subunit